MYYVTSRRVPFGHKSANGTSFTHTTSANLRPINWNGRQWERDVIVSDLMLAGMDILMNDPTVIAVTSIKED